MKKLTLMLTALSLAAIAPITEAQPQAPGGSSSVSSYSPPTVKHVKKPKKKKNGASAPTTAPQGASQ
ncbi:hypothetical protein [Paraburkholderia terrae]|uniref:Acid-shock protein n=1 Tax=Paraburkholderia terrae TaxID=311230 RepID=A0A2I8EHK2_9BURK|nr:hypothetical protein [Paraburkholderia terrae]AUT58334.1 acid-shock protein [Paraburkholderia terrae]